MIHERQPKSELNQALLEAYTTTFISRTDMYPLQIKDGTYVTIQKPLTSRLVAAHLKGYITIGAYALDKHGWAKWLCFDADDEKQFQALIGLATNLEKLAVTSYIEPSRRGGHLWLFTPEIPGFQIRRFGKQLLAEHKIDKKAVELYPKQDKPITGPGSCVRIPLGVHRVSNRRYHFITLDDQPLAPTIREQIRILTKPVLVPQTFIDEILARAPEPKRRSPTPQFKLTPDTGGSVSERIKHRISVYSFVSEYVELDERGRGYCPFHDDEHKSFSVSEQANYWNCFAGCGGGSVIDFWMKWRKKGFKATVKELAKMLL